MTTIASDEHFAAAIGWLRETSAVEGGVQRDGAANIRVTASAAGHERVKRQLALVKRDLSKHISVSCQIYEVNPAALAKLPLELREKVLQSQAPIPTAAAVLSSVEARQLINALEVEDPDHTQVTAPRLTLNQQQRAWVEVRTDHEYVAAIDGATGKEQLGTVASGIMLQTQGTIVAEGDDLLSVMADLHRVNLLDLATDEATGVQTPKLQELRVQRLLTLRSGETTLLAPLPTGTPVGDDRVTLVLISAELIAPNQVQ